MKNLSVIFSNTGSDKLIFDKVLKQDSTKIMNMLKKNKKKSAIIGRSRNGNPIIAELTEVELVEENS